MAKFDRFDAYDIAQRFVGMKEIVGDEDNPAIMTFLKLDNSWPEHDEVPWCSGFVNYVAWLCRLPRSKSLRARSWLEVGYPIKLEDAGQGDIVILNRGGPPDPNIIEAPGHVGFFAGYVDHGNGAEFFEILGGNQSNTVKVSRYHANELLGIRRIG